MIGARPGAARGTMTTLANAHALVIGVSKYQHVTPLPPVQDAQDMHAVLHDPAICAYPPEDAAPPLLEGAATRDAIVAGLKRLADRTNRKSTVFVYFSGHGMQDSEGNAYLMPVDGDAASDQTLRTTAIGGPELSALLKAIPARRLTVVLDCCRASALVPRDVRRQTKLPTDRLLALASGDGRAVFAASRDDGYAWVVPGAQNGIFTGHLLDGLKGAAYVAGDSVLVCDLFFYVQRKIAAMNLPQIPVFDATLQQNYPVALYRGGQAPALVVPAAPAGTTYKYDGFVSYRRDDPADKKWVEKVMVPRLEQAGLKLCLEHRDFSIGESRLKEMERAVQGSRYTIGVFTPAYLTGPFQNFQQTIARFLSVQSTERRFLPLRRVPCEPDLGVQATEMLDVSDEDEVGTALDRLAVKLREPPRRGLAD